MCFDLKQKHTRLKRNIKFDDDTQDLYADVQLQPDGDWKKLLPADARVVRAKGKFIPASTSLTADILDDLLGNEGDSSRNSTPATGANSVPPGRRPCPDRPDPSS